MSDETEEADRLPGTPHPRDMHELIGHEAAERAVLDAYRGGRMHHAWLISGQQGIGKATLAYRMARFLLAYPRPQLVEADRTDLSLPTNHPVMLQVQAGAHPDMVVLNRAPNPEKQFKVPTVIPVDYVRKVVSFFGNTASAGGWRICIVDSADEMNTQAANALLKVLEEPPERSIFLIINHVAGTLLPTIRSRCRLLPLHPLDDRAMGQALNLFDVTRAMADDDRWTLMRAAEGSVREALAIALGGEVAMLDAVQKQLTDLPDIDWMMLHSLAEKMPIRDNALFDAVMAEVGRYIHNHVAMHGSLGARALAPWAEVWEKVEIGAARVRTYNLDRKPFIFSVFGWLAALRS